MVALRHEDQSHRPAHRRPALRIVGRADAADAPLPLVRRNMLPEHFAYADTGRELARSCLRCPLARCQHDEPGGVRRMVAEARDREIALLRRRHRAPIDMLADTYGLSRRHIFRILREQP